MNTTELLLNMFNHDNGVKLLAVVFGIIQLVTILLG